MSFGTASAASVQVPGYNARKNKAPERPARVATIDSMNTPKPLFFLQRESRLLLVLGAVQLLLLAVLFGQTYFFGYVFFDDDHYVLDNRFVQQGLTGESLHWAFTSVYLSNWHPVSWLSHMLDVELFGANVGLAHLHNVLLHGLNSLLVYLFLKRLTHYPLAAALASTLFLVHPLHVESVAWLAERKDLLCALFFLAGLLAYDRYRQAPGLSLYFLCCLCLLAALMSKPMAVTFPCLLLVLDVFHYRRLVTFSSSTAAGWRWLLLEKLPLFALVLGASLVTVSVQQEGGALVSGEALGLSERVINALLSYLTYLRQSLLPLGLTAFYPMPQSTSLGATGLPLLVLACWLAASIRFLSTRPLIAAGLCWYLGTLVPVIGLVQVGAQAHADRYMYLPSVGILLAIAALVPRPGSASLRLFVTVSVLLLGFYSVLCYWQVGVWESRHSLFSRVLQVHGSTWRAHFHLAADYTQRGRYADASHHAALSLQLDPDRTRSLQLMGDIALHQGDFVAAIGFYREAVSLGSPGSDLMNNFGIALAETGAEAEAQAAFQRAYALDPTSIAASRNLRASQ